MSMSNKKILAAAEEAARSNGYKFQDDNSSGKMSDSQILQQAKANSESGFSYASANSTLKKPNGRRLYDYDKGAYNRAIAIARNKQSSTNNTTGASAVEVDAGKDNTTSTSFLDKFKSPSNKEGNTGFDRASGNAKDTTLRKLYTAHTGEKEETTSDYLSKQQKLIDSYGNDVQTLVEKYNKIKKEYENQSAIDTANAANGFYGSINTTDYSKQLKDIKAQLVEKGLSENEIDQLAEAESWVYNASQREEQKKSLESTTESKVGNIGAHVFDVAVNSVAALPGAVQIAADKVAGKRTDPNSNAFAITNFQTDLEEGQQAKNTAYWQEKTGKEGSWQEKLANFGYNVGMSTAKSLAAAAEGGGFASSLGLSGTAATVVGNMATLPSFGEQAFVSTYNEAKERGLDDDRAMKTAVVSGLAEMGTEVISLDKLWDVYKNAGKAGAESLVLNAFVQAGIEGSEEGVNDIINQIADLAINGDQSAYAESVNSYMAEGMSQEEAEKMASKEFWAQTFEDFLAGAASGGISAAIATGAGVHNNKTTGNNIQGNEETFVNGISDDRADYNSDRDYQKAQETVLDVIDSEGKELTKKEKYDLGKRVNQAVEAQNTSFSDNIDDANTHVINNKINNATTTEELASIRDRIPAEYANNESVAKAIETKAATLGATVEDLEAIQTPEKIYKAAYEGKLTSADIDSLQDDNLKNAAKLAALRATSENVKNISKEDASKALVNGKVMELTSNITEEDGAYYIETKGGEKVDLAEATFSDKGNLLFFGNDYAAGITSLDSPELMTVALNAKKDSSAPSTSVISTLKQFNTVGRTTNQTFEEYMQKETAKKKAQFIPEKYLKEAFNLNKSELEISDKRKEEGKVGKSKGVITKGFAEALRESEDIDLTTTLVKTLTAKVGLKLDAKEMEGESRANYNPEIGVITLNKEMINEAYSALFHEGFGEYLQKHNAKDYKAISDTMLNYLEDKLGSKAYTEMVDAYQQAYRRSHTAIDENKTAREAANEMVNDTLFALFSSKEGMQDMIDWTSEAMPVQERKTFLETFKSILDDVIKALDHFLKTGSFNSAERAALEMEKDQAKAMRQMVLDAMDVAIENRDKATEASEIVDNLALKGRKSIRVDEPVSALEENNIPYETNEEGNEKAKKEAVNVTENARFSKKVLDDGRIADNLADVLTIEEYAELRSMIDSGNKPTYKTNTKEAVYRLDNKLVYTDSRKLNFGISKIVDVNNYKDVSDVNAILDLYSDIDTEGVNYEQQIRLIESYFGKKCFTEYTTKDWGNTERYDRPTKRNKGRSDAYHAEREQNRKRVFVKDGVVVEDTRKSVKVTDARNSFKEYGEASPYTDSLEEVEVVSTILSKANQALGGIKSVKESSLNRISRSVIKKYKSNVEVEELSKNIFQAFSQMAENKLESNYESVMDYMLNIGDEVIANSQLKDPDSERVYNEARKNLQGYNIKLTETDKEELKNAYGTLIKGMGTLKKHGINLSKDGQSIDSLYSQIRSEMLNITGVQMEDVTPADQLLEIISTMESVEPTPYLWDGANDLDKSLSVVADIIDGYYTEVAKTYNKDVEKTALFKAKKSINKEFEKYKTTREQEYKDRLNSLIKQLDERNQAGWQPYMEGWEDFGLKLMTEKEIKATAKQKADKQLNSYKEAVEKSKQIDNIRRTGNRMIKWLTQPTDKQHVPDFLRAPLGNFLYSIDFIGGKGDSKMALEWQSKMDSLKALMQKVERAEAAGDDSIEAYFAQGTIASEMVDKMDHFIRAYGANKKLRDLGATGLKELSEIMSSISAAINSMNNTYANDVFSDRASLAESTVEEISKAKKRKNHTRLGNTALDFATIDELEPIRYFERLGSAAKSVFDELRQGFDVRTARIKQASEYMEQFKKDNGIENKSINKWSGEYSEFDLADGKVTLTIPQIMSLYELSKRKQAKPHIVLGGIKATDFKGVKGRIHHQSKAVHIHYGEMMTIIDTLTDEQKAMADAMQQYMATECSGWGNNVTKKMFGYSKFTEKDYFPIRTDSMSRGVNATSDNVPSYYTIKNQGFTKAVIPSSNNALVLDDIFDVFTKHVVGMANYEGYTLPICDAMRWFNYSETIQNAMVKEGDIYGKRRESRNNVREAIDELMGKNGGAYFQQFIKDINGDYAGAGGELSLLNTLMGNYKAQAVMANIRVVVQQPTAIVRAAEQIESKYLTEALLSLPNANKLAEKAQENSEIAYWKAQGYYETMIGTSMKGIITGDTSWRDKLNNLAGYLAGKADDLTWGIMYRAAELKVQKTMPELEYDSKEFTEETVKLFNNIIDHTQVVDTIFHKSQLMRSQRDSVKMLTSFMAEPTKTYNMLLAAFDDVYQADNKEAKQQALNKAGRIAKIFLVEQALNAIVTALVDVARDDDKDGWSLETYWNQLKENFFDNIKVWNLLPILKEVENMIDGYDTTNYQMESLSSAVETIQAIAKWSKDPDSTPLYGKLYTIAQGISQVWGIPLAAALKEVKTLNNNLNDIWGGKDWYKTASAEKSAAKTKSYNDAVEIYDSNDLNSIKSHLKEVYDEKLEEEGAEEGDGYTAMRTELKKQFQRQYNPEDSSRTSVINRYKTLLKQTKKSDSKGGYRALSDKEITNMIDSWIESQE